MPWHVRDDANYTITSPDADMPRHVPTSWECGVVGRWSARFVAHVELVGEVDAQEDKDAACHTYHCDGL